MQLTKLVKSVEFVAWDKCMATWVDGSTVSVQGSVGWVKINVKPFPTLKISDKIESKQRIWTAELEFYTPETISDQKPLIWRIGLTNGKFMLIGDGNRPYPILAFTDSLPDSPTENQLLAVKVTFNSVKKIPYIR